jgi:aldehyde:ferredoxin oxidoreductase
MSVYKNKFLKIDLSKKEYTEETIDSGLINKFGGGRGFGIDHLYRELAPGTEPYSPDNRMLFVPGILAGTMAPGFSRWIVMTKSPLTGGYGRAVGGGKFGAAIKISGYDFISIRGKAEKPSYVYIGKEGVQFVDAQDLWGLDTQETQERLCGKYGNRTHVACIGPAGENLVRFAAIIHEKRAAARCGVGAVMGSKNLKALVINNSGFNTPTLHDRDGFMKLVKEHNEILKTHARRQKLTQMGTTFMTMRMHEMGIFPVKNFQEGSLPGVEGISAETLAKLKVEDYGCYACTTRCGNVFRAMEGPYKGAESEGPEYETLFSFGGEVANTEIGAIIAADALCDRLGIDTISMGVVVGFVMELFQRGILTASELDGLEPTWGDHSMIFKLIDKVVRKDGIGALLSEGTRIAGEKIGRGADYYAMHAKGLELPGYEPRAAKVHGLGYATSNIGGSHMYGYSRQEISGFAEPRTIDRFTDEGKGDVAGWNQIKKAVEETGILCNFADSNITPQLVADLFVTSTGLKEFGDVSYLDKIGERIVCMERCFNIREGWSRKEDTLPERMFKEPLKNAGPATGEVIRKMDALLDEYYTYMGYDKNGMPTEEKLKALDLENVTPDVNKHRT